MFNAADVWYERLETLTKGEPSISRRFTKHEPIKPTKNSDVSVTLDLRSIARSLALQNLDWALYIQCVMHTKPAFQTRPPIPCLYTSIKYNKYTAPTHPFPCRPSRPSGEPPGEPRPAAPRPPSHPQSSTPRWASVPSADSAQQSTDRHETRTPASSASYPF